MRRFYSIFAVLLVAVFVGCSDDEVVPEIGDGIIRVWQCRMIVTNSDGNDLVNPLNYEPQSVSERQFTFADENCREVYKTSYQMVNTETGESEKLYMDIASSPRVMSFECHKSAETNEELDNYKETTYKLVCPGLFGDDKEHTLTAYWTNKGVSKAAKLLRVFLDTSENNICSRLVVDGTSYEAGEDGIIRISF